MRYRLGNVLIWLGALTWLPFIVLRIAGEKPSLFWYLPFHPLGVSWRSAFRIRRPQGDGHAATQKESLAGLRAWLIHFLQDVIIFGGLLLVTL